MDILLVVYALPFGSLSFMDASHNYKNKSEEFS